MAVGKRLLAVVDRYYAGVVQRLVLKWFIHAHVLWIQLLEAQRRGVVGVTLTGTGRCRWAARALR